MPRKESAELGRNRLTCFERQRIGGPRGRQGRVPPLSPNFFVFMQFSGKIDQNNRLAPPTSGLAPHPLGNPESATAEFNVLLSLSLFLFLARSS